MKHRYSPVTLPDNPPPPTRSSHPQQQFGEDQKLAKRHLELFFKLDIFIEKSSLSCPRPSPPPSPLLSGAGGVGQVEHDGGVGGLKADGAGWRVDERRVAVCHDPVAWGRRTRESATGNIQTVQNLKTISESLMKTTHSIFLSFLWTDSFT